MSSAGISNVAVAMANSQLQIQAALKHYGCACGTICAAMVLVERLRHDPVTSASFTQRFAGFVEVRRVS